VVVITSLVREALPSCLSTYRIYPSWTCCSQDALAENDSICWAPLLEAAFHPRALLQQHWRTALHPRRFGFYEVQEHFVNTTVKPQAPRLLQLATASGESTAAVLVDAPARTIWADEVEGAHKPHEPALAARTCHPWRRSRFGGAATCPSPRCRCSPAPGAIADRKPLGGGVTITEDEDSSEASPPALDPLPRINPVSALPCMRLMPDIVVLNTAASTCGQPGRWQPALHLLGSTAGMDLEADMISFNSSLGACGTAGRWREAAGLLVEAAAGAVKASAVTLNATIDACAEQWDTALKLLEFMKTSMLEATSISFNSTINACEKGASFRPAAGDVPSRIRDDISGPSSLSDWPRGTFLLDAMRQRGLLPDIFGFNSAVSACEKAIAGWEVPLQLLQQMEELRVVKDVVSFSSTISAHEKVGLWEASLGLLWQLPKAEVSPNSFTFNAVMAACAVWAPPRRRASLALGLLREMRGMRVRADVVTYNALLRTACIDDGLEEELQKLVAQAVKPNMVSYGTVLDFCRTYGRWKRGLHVVDSLRWKQVAWDVVSCNSLLASCRGRQWQIAQKLLDEMIREELAPNAVSRSAAIFACEAGEMSVPRRALLR
ncbi:unnamed protein product, partial [Symbiodinium sp. KB8]